MDAPPPPKDEYYPSPAIVAGALYISNHYAPEVNTLILELQRVYKALDELMRRVEQLEKREPDVMKDFRVTEALAGLDPRD